MKQKKTSGKSDRKKYLGKKLLSIDIGQHTTKIVYGRTTKAGVEVRRAIAIQTPKGSVENGRIGNVELLVEKISSLIKEEKLKAEYGFCTVETNKVVAREIVLPTADKEAMNNMLQFEVQHNMPIDLSNFSVQSRIIGTSEENGTKKTHFLCTAVPESLAAGYFDLLQKLGIKAAVMDIQSNSVEKLFEQEFRSGGESVIPADKSVAVIDFGYSKINVILLKNGKYRFNRLIDDGAAGIDVNLSAQFNYSEEEIEDKKANDVDLGKSTALFSDNYPSENENTLWREANTVKSVIDNWITEIERIFSYYNNKNREKVEKVLIYGGTVSMKGFAPYLSEALGLPVELIKELGRVNVSAGTAADLTPFINPIGAMIRR